MRPKLEAGRAARGEFLGKLCFLLVALVAGLLAVLLVVHLVRLLGVDR